MKKRSLARRLTYSLIAFAIFAGLTLGLAEIATRHFYHPSPHFQTADLDPELGWRPHPHWSVNQTVQNHRGGTYQAEYRTTRDGFREFGSPKADRPKVLFIGDSFTQAAEVSNEKTFYRLLQDSLEFELFAFGQSVYGTLQEYLILDQYIDEIQPDLLVWQTCENDFIDNHLALEKESRYNARLRRPYLGLDGQIRQDQPSGVPVWLRRSRFLSYLDLQLHVRWVQRTIARKRIAERLIAEQGRAYDRFDEAIRISSKIAKKIVERVPKKTRVIAFATTIYQPQLNEMEALFQQAGIPFFCEPAFAVDCAVQEKKNVLVVDQVHWNEAGHRLVASTLRPIVAGYLSFK